MRFYEHANRSLAKTILYRILIIISTAATTFFVTKDGETTVSVTVLQSIASTIIYYLHERMWNHIHWGKVHKKK